MYFVYMLRCRGGSLYTGIAADMENACGSTRPAARPAQNTRVPTRPKPSPHSIRQRITQPLHGWKR